MQLVRILLFPISVAYGIIAYLYHWLYNQNILSSRKFDIPVISVGNLTTGGTGKTPHVEFIIRHLLNDKMDPEDIATLSRGYGRATSGFILAQPNATAAEIGDEPRQFIKKFNHILVAVNENRVEGVQKLMKVNPDLKIVLLDDAFQHRRIQSGMSILLMNYQFFSTSQYILPTGNLREPMSGLKRADIIVVTNSPIILSPMERRRIKKMIKPIVHQKIYYSYISYGAPKYVFEHQEEVFREKVNYFGQGFTVFLFTGIANTVALMDYYNSLPCNVVHLPFSDHHEYSMEDVKLIKEKFDNIASPKKVIFTTEKDAMRLAIPGLEKAMRALPVFYLPIEVKFSEGDHQLFNEQISEYVGKNQKYSKLHSG